VPKLMKSILTAETLLAMIEPLASFDEDEGEQAPTVPFFDEDEVKLQLHEEETESAHAQTDRYTNPVPVQPSTPPPGHLLASVAAAAAAAAAATEQSAASKPPLAVILAPISLRRTRAHTSSPVPRRRRLAVHLAGGASPTVASHPSHPLQILAAANAARRVDMMRWVCASDLETTIALQSSDLLRTFEELPERRRQTAERRES
jgi:hypothetical protein